MIDQKRPDGTEGTWPHDDESISGAPGETVHGEPDNAAPDNAASDDPTLASEDAAHSDDVLSALQAENAQLRDHVVRTLADMENLRKRTEREKDDARKFAVSGFAKDLLTVADNLDRALAAMPTGDDEHAQIAKPLAEGVEAVQRELMAAFERNGIQRIEALGAPFDSNLHEAVMQAPTADYPPGTVSQDLRTGYTLHGRLLRATMVAVAAAPPAAADGDRDGDGGTVDKTV